MIASVGICLNGCWSLITEQYTEKGVLEFPLDKYTGAEYTDLCAKSIVRAGP
jgi:hypothetical protein